MYLGDWPLCYSVPGIPGIPGVFHGIPGYSYMSNVSMCKCVNNKQLLFFIFFRSSYQIMYHREPLSMSELGLPPQEPPLSSPGSMNGDYITQLERNTHISRKGGRIVKPTNERNHHYPKGGMWMDDSKNVIPLDRGGKHLPRYMQETSVSKTKLAYKHNDQTLLRKSRKQARAAKDHPENLVEQRRKLVAEYHDLKTKRSEWSRIDKALDIDLANTKRELAQLEELDSLEKVQETTRGRLEREFNDLDFQ